MRKTSVTRRDALKVGILCATGGGILSQKLTAARASQHSPPSEDEVSLSNRDIEYIEPDPDAGFNYPYFLYAPENAKSADGHKRPLLVEPTATGVGRDAYAEMFEIAKRTMEGYVTDLAGRIGVPAIHPVFPKYRNSPYRYYENPQALTWHVLTLDDDEEIARPDKQLLAMVADARDRLTTAGHTLAEKIHFDGFSVSGTFSNRFAVMHPERVNAITVGGNGALILPMEQLTDDVSTITEPDWDSFSHPDRSLPYPAGVYDLDDLIGKEFNRSAWESVSKYIYLGKEDQPDPEEDPIRYLGFSRNYRALHRLERGVDDDFYGIPELMEDIYGKLRVDTRWETSKAAYNSLDPDAEFTLYDGMGHARPPRVVNDIASFHTREIRETYGPFFRLNGIYLSGPTITSEGSAPQRLRTNKTLTIQSNINNLVSTTRTVNAALNVGGSEVKTITRDIPGGGREEIEFEYTFTDPGYHTVEITGEQMITDDAASERLQVVTPDTPIPTPTPSPTPTATPSPTPNPDTPTTSESTATPGESGPGFGLGAAISGVAATGYLLAQRFTE